MQPAARQRLPTARGRRGTALPGLQRPAPPSSLRCGRGVTDGGCAGTRSARTWKTPRSRESSREPGAAAGVAAARAGWARAALHATTNDKHSTEPRIVLQPRRSERATTHLGQDRPRSGPQWVDIRGPVAFRGTQRCPEPFFRHPGGCFGAAQPVTGPLRSAGVWARAARGWHWRCLQSSAGVASPGHSAHEFTGAVARLGPGQGWLEQTNQTTCATHHLSPPTCPICCSSCICAWAACCCAACCCWCCAACCRFTCCCGCCCAGGCCPCACACARACPCPCPICWPPTCSCFTPGAPAWPAAPLAPPAPPPLGMGSTLSAAAASSFRFSCSCRLALCGASVGAGLWWGRGAWELQRPGAGAHCGLQSDGWFVPP